MLVIYNFYTCIYAVFLKEMYLDICHMQRHKNSGQLMLTDCVGPPYTVV